MMTAKNNRKKTFFQKFRSSLGSCVDGRTDGRTDAPPSLQPLLRQAPRAGLSSRVAARSRPLGPRRRLPSLVFSGWWALPPDVHANIWHGVWGGGGGGVCNRGASRCGNSHVTRDQNGQNLETGPVGSHGRSPALLQPGLPLLWVFLKMHIYIYIKKK